MTDKTVLVDLDGTLTDPADGIIGGVQHALRALEAPVPPRADLTWVIGPPLRVAFPGLLPEPTHERVEQAVAAYRDYYSRQGIYQATVFAGVPAMLRALEDAGYDLLLCTVKPRVFAGPVLEHFKLNGHFAGVYGAELDGRFEDKADLMAHIIAEHDLDPAGMAMIGDRGLDMSAAVRNGIAPLGVTWGYGSAEELRTAGAAVLCEAPQDVAGQVRALLDA